MLRVQDAQQVYDMLREAHLRQTDSDFSHALYGQPLCCHAFRKVLGLGQDRFQKINRAARSGAPVPRDGRFVARQGLFPKAHLHRQLCADYLEEISQTVAEVMPENHGQVHSEHDADVEGSEPLPRKLKFRRHRGRRPKIAGRKRLKEDRDVLRLLPPGGFSDYLGVLRSRHPDKSISLKLFSKAGHFEFVLDKTYAAWGSKLSFGVRNRECC